MTARRGFTAPTRTQQVCVRMTEDERAAWTAVAVEHNVSLPELLRLGMSFLLLTNERSQSLQESA